MNRNFNIKPSQPYMWVEMKSNEEYASDIREKCTKEYLAHQLRSDESLTVESVELNDSGTYSEPGMLFGFIPRKEETGLPAYYRVTLKKRMKGGRTATLLVHLPLVWNERFLGLTGGGSSSYQDYQQYLFASSTPWTIAVRNHFACAQTDCGIGFMRFDWGFKPDSNEVDWDLLKEWGYEAAHDVAVIGKLVTSIVYGKKPVYSYISGISAGGRTTNGEVQRYPLDYNGAWVQCAAAPWITHLMSQSWAYFVMLHNQHPIAKVKMEAFYEGLLRKYGCEQKGYINNCYMPEFDPQTMVGVETGAGVITSEDARIMQLIIDGPQYRDGRKMPKCDAMGANVRYAEFLTYDEKGEVPTGVQSLTALQGFRWVLENPTLDFKDISRDDFDRMYDIATSSFKDLDNQDPDITPFQQAGGKLLLTHATSDQCVPVLTTMKYYHDVLRNAESREAAREYVSCFISKGGAHGDREGKGELMSFPHVWASLMHWVEDHVIPEEIPTQVWNKEEQRVELSGNTEKAFNA